MLTLLILPEPLAICRLSPAEDVPDWAMIGESPPAKTEASW